MGNKRLKIATFFPNGLHHENNSMVFSLILGFQKEFHIAHINCAGFKEKE